MTKKIKFIIDKNLEKNNSFIYIYSINLNKLS